MTESVGKLEHSFKEHTEKEVTAMFMLMIKTGEDEIKKIDDPETKEIYDNIK